MDHLWQDLRYGARVLRARPAFTAIAVLTIALGIAANTAIFSAVNALLLRPLPVRDVDRLVFGMALREGTDPFGTSFLDYGLYRSEARSFDDMGIATQRQFTLLGGQEPEHLDGAEVTASYLTTLGIRPVLGRVFREEEDRPGGPAVALVSHALWQRRFGGARDAIGLSLQLDGVARTIVGVLPPGFDLPFSAEIWLPRQTSLESLPLQQRAATANALVARLRRGVAIERANAELKALAKRLEQEYPQIRRGWSYGVIPLRRALLGDIEGTKERSLLVLTGAVAFLLLICCANVASLLLARGVARRGEMAIRRSLGATRGRLAAQLVTESALLACCGGTAGVLLANWAMPGLAALNPIQTTGLSPYLTDFALDTRVLCFSVAVTVLTGALFGIAPALAAARRDEVMSALKQCDQRTATGAGRRSLAVLVVAEVAVAATLLVGGALMAQSFHRLERIQLGFRPEHLLMVELPLSAAKYEKLEARVELIDRVLERVRALPGVSAAGMTSNVPMQRGTTIDSVYEVEGRPRTDPTEVPITAHRLVSGGYEETLGLRLTAGRFLDDHDRPGTLPVVVVSEELARQSWPGENPIGKRVRRIRAGERGPWMTVVGVVKDVKEDRFNFRIARPVWYAPYAQQAFALPVSIPLNLLVRTEGDPERVAAAVRAQIRAVDADQPVANVMPLREQLSDLLVADRFAAILLGALATVGMLLAALGLYGVLAYSVGQRTGEIGLRMALGARQRDVLRLVVREGLRLAGTGLVLGVAGAWVLTRLLAVTLYEVSPTDPLTFAAVCALLATVAFFACWIPARRATRIEPMAALRCE
jgi:putative ABC transport system permease protein